MYYCISFLLSRSFGSTRLITAQCLGIGGVLGADFITRRHFITPIMHHSTKLSGACTTLTANQLMSSPLATRRPSPPTDRAICVIADF